MAATRQPAKTHLNSKGNRFKALADYLEAVGFYGDQAYGTPGHQAPCVYMAGPISNVDPSQATAWRDNLRSRLGEIGIFTFDPYRSWHGERLTRATMADVDLLLQPVNDLALAMASQVVVAYQHYGNPVNSVGTDYELEMAQLMGKPIVSFPVVEDNGLIGSYKSWVEQRDRGKGLWYTEYSINGVIGSIVAGVIPLSSCWWVT